MGKQIIHSRKRNGIWFRAGRKSKDVNQENTIIAKAELETSDWFPLKGRISGEYKTTKRFRK